MRCKLIVTHHAPDLDAIGAVWMLKTFDAQHFASSRVAFVNPGDTLSENEAQEHDCSADEITHVDTGLGEFDHHQPERGHEFISATSLTYDHVCQVHPELKQDKALAAISQFTTEIDHFQEIDWPEPENTRYAFMLHELIRGRELQELNDDDAQLHFGITCLDSVYANLTVRFKAEEIVEQEGQMFDLSFGKCLALETSNDETIKLAQKQGYQLVVRKDPKLGNIRIKARPDSDVDLKAAHSAILKIDSEGSWYYHPSGKMLINGSSKHHNQTPSRLSLSEVIAVLKEAYV